MLMMAFGTLVAIIFDHAYDFAFFCSGTGDESLPACAREWVGATSGWAATIAGVATIFLLYRQNAGQKKQTDFLLGEARPTIDALQHLHRSEDVVIRIVNWNRRPIVLKTIRVPGLKVEIGLKHATIKDRENPTEGFKIRHLQDHALDPPIAMHGWKNRSEAPCEVRLDIVGRLPRTPMITDWVGQRVEVEILIAGEDGDSTTLICPISVAE